MGIYEITVRTRFTARHGIRLPDGTCEPLHGHRWSVWVTVAARKLDAIETVMDFHVLEQRVREIVAPWKGRTLNHVPPFGDGREKLRVSPTAERVAERIGRMLRGKLPRGVKLVGVAVEEERDCVAMWRPGK